MKILFNLFFLFVATSSFSQNVAYQKLHKRLPYLIQFNTAFDNLDNYPECNEKDCQYKKIPINQTYQEAYPFINEFALVKSKGRYGIIDKKGEFIVEPLYSNIEFVGGSIKFNEKICFSFRNGKTYDSCEYPICGYPVTYGGIESVKNNKYQVFDRIKKKRSQAFDSIVSAGMHYLVKKNDKWGVLEYDSIFKQTISHKYKDAKFINFHIALLNHANLWEYYKIDKNAKLIAKTKILCEPYECIDDKVIGVFKTENGKYNLLYNDKSTFEEFDFINPGGLYGLKENKIYVIKNKSKHLLYSFN